MGTLGFEHHIREWTIGDPRDGMECLAWLSESNDTDEAIVFVHGFLGDNDPRVSERLFARSRGGGTFRGFDDLIARHHRFKGTDCYFVGYRSVRDDTQTNAARLLGFLRRQFRLRPGGEPGYMRNINDPSLVNSATAIRQSTPPYKRLTFAAHSEGGVVVRKAILRAFREQGARWDLDDEDIRINKLIYDAHLLLFAPAQGGTRAAGLISVFDDMPIIGGASRALRALSPAYYDLTSESIGLDQLRVETEALRGKACRATTLWADSDRVVEAVDYSTDAPSWVLKNSTHTEVCKPDEDRRGAILSFFLRQKPPSAAIWGGP